MPNRCCVILAAGEGKRMRSGRPKALEEVLTYCHAREIQIMHLEISRGKEPENVTIALLSVRLAHQMKAEEALKAMADVDGVMLAEEF